MRSLTALPHSGCQAAAKGVEFVVSHAEVPPAVRGTPLPAAGPINLAGNAVKFTERGSVTVHVVRAKRNRIQRAPQFSVRDTGIGIRRRRRRASSKALRRRTVHTRRFAAQASARHREAGSCGLMGGKIGLESAVGSAAPSGSSCSWRSSLSVWVPAPASSPAPGSPRRSRRPTRAARPCARGLGSHTVAVADVEAGVARLVAEISLAKPYHSAVRIRLGRRSEARAALSPCGSGPCAPHRTAVPRDADVQRFDALSSGFAAVLELPFDKRQLFNVLHSVSAADEVARRRHPAAGLCASRRRSEENCVLLVADDNATNREVIGRILDRGGHSATIVNDGEQASTTVRERAVMTSALGPQHAGARGIEALRALRLMIAPERLPVAICPRTRRRAERMSRSWRRCFLAKPIEAARLLDELQSFGAAKPERRGARSLRPLQPGHRNVARAPTVINPDARRSGRARLVAGLLEKLIGVFIADNTRSWPHGASGRGTQLHEFKSLLHAMKGSSAAWEGPRPTRVDREPKMINKKIIIHTLTKI